MFFWKSSAIMVVINCFNSKKDGLMAYTHGTLENEILNAIWSMEENQTEDNGISVSDVLSKINNGTSVRAYTTVKTVMDRLVEKNLLKRQKSGKKFCYNSVESREKMAETAINKLALQYFNNDMRSLMKALEKRCLSTKA